MRVFEQKEYMALTFQTNDMEAIIGYNLQQKDYSTFPEKCHGNIFNTWATLHNRQSLTNEQVVREIIWNNSFIKVDFKTLYYKDWVE